ncbi:T9SS type A sorting domain-containing protein [Taibaiella koreensis]|uniref:T9SS type A sorting domain-containing protein n=1 Tax=Taibaiella koreensis TaxID=1268548 RepID=UPI000E59E3A5|nr:T9SS type A sorting domain-containing protein [Taibaiella koreensis]
MNSTFTLRRRMPGMAICYTLFFSLMSYTALSQIQLVQWTNFFSGPPVDATSYLAMNSGKQLTNGGQGSAFVSGGQYIANNWSVGNYFQANFSTVNYSSNTITFLLGAFEFGAKNFKLQYATGTATNFQDFGNTITFPSPGGEGTYTYNLPTACNNQANVYIRITATSASNGGGDYWDDVEVKGLAMTAPSITSQPSNSTICEGADATFTVTANNAISYQWQFRSSSSGTFANCPSNTIYDNETTATLTVNNVTTAMSGYQFRCVVTGGTTPNATSNNATMTVNAYGTWNGSMNANWDNPSNWNCGQVPTATTNVTINSGGTQPIINVGTATCNNLTINSGATLSFTGTTNQLDIKGTASGAGTLNGTGGKVIFSGTGAQTIPGGTYKDLQMNGAGSKTLGGNATVNGIMTFTSGTLTLGSNNLTISATGSIASGAGPNSFAVTNGTGMLVNQNIGAGGKTGSYNFPVGATATSYTPLILNNATGTADNFSVQVKNGVYSSYSGTTGTGAITANVVNKTWFVSEGTVGGSNATVQLTWNEIDEAATFVRAACCVSHYTGGAWNPAPLGFAGGADPYSMSRSGITSFSPFGVGSTNSPLLLDLLTFSGKRVSSDIALSWETANEKAVRSFDIERSADGEQFAAVGTVAAANRDAKNSYSYTDRNAPASALYYRLKMIDIDGASKYSTVVRIAAAGTDAVVLYPNPVKDGVLNIQLNDKITSGLALIITDVAGKVVRSEQRTGVQGNGQLIGISVKALPAGSYFLRIDANGTTISNTRFVKQ